MRRWGGRLRPRLAGEHVLPAFVARAPRSASAVRAEIRRQRRGACRRAGIQVNLGKARAWNAGGVLPPGVDAFGTAEDPSWVGDLSLPPHQQGLVVLGSPLGSHAFTQAVLAEKRASQDTLLQRIPAVPHLQSAFHTHAFAREHDAAVLRCLGRLLSAEEPRARCPAAPLARGGMGLRSAERGRSAAYWAPWADTLPMIQERLAGNLALSLAAGGQRAPSVRAAAVASSPPRGALTRAARVEHPGWQRARRNGA